MSNNAIALSLAAVFVASMVIGATLAAVISQKSQKRFIRTRVEWGRHYLWDTTQKRCFFESGKYVYIPDATEATCR